MRISSKEKNKTASVVELYSGGVKVKEFVNVTNVDLDDEVLKFINTDGKTMIWRGDFFNRILTGEKVMRTQFLFILLMMALPLSAQENIPSNLKALSPVFDQADFADPSGTVSLVVSMPFKGVNWQFSGAFSSFGIGNMSDQHLGNPGIGVKIGDFVVSANIPVGGKNNFSQNAALLAFSDSQLEAFTPDVVPFKISTAQTFSLQAKHEFQVSAAILSLYAYKQTYVNNAFEFFLPFSVASVNKFKAVDFGVGLNGNYLLSEWNRNFSDSSVFQLGFWLGLQLGKFHPSAGIKFPLDNGTETFLQRTWQAGFSGSF